MFLLILERERRREKHINVSEKQPSVASSMRPTRELNP